MTLRLRSQRDATINREEHLYLVLCSFVHGCIMAILWIIVAYLLQLIFPCCSYDLTFSLLSLHLFARLMFWTTVRHPHPKGSLIRYAWVTAYFFELLFLFSCYIFYHHHRFVRTSTIPDPLPSFPPPLETEKSTSLQQLKTITTCATQKYTTRL